MWHSMIPKEHRSLEAKHEKPQTTWFHLQEVQNMQIYKDRRHCQLPGTVVRRDTAER